MSRLILVLCLFAFTSCFNKQNAELESEGFCGTSKDYSTKFHVPQIFKAKCASCHSIDKDLTGPKMSGILDRVPSEEWLRHFITNQDSLVQIEDEYALEIMNWSPVKWDHNLSDLPKRDVDTLIKYITQ